MELLFLGGTSIPVFSCSTVLGNPPTLVAITGI